MHVHHLLVILVALDGQPSDTVPLYTDLGDHHVPITTPVSLAQRYFDQGMRLLYGFNHGEAIRSFNHAAQLDSNCAMCYWGVACAYGPHVNAGMDSAAGLAAYQALQQALARERAASPRERAYIDALAKRYAPIPPADRAALDAAYAAAMGDVVKRYPKDLDAATLYAEALMDKRPWNYWDKKTGQPYPGTREIVAQLERVLRSEPRHPGACHYYIHAVEALAPEKAVACAERLAALMPGAGHLVHMPAHIYIRVGRYADAIAVNEHAVHADEVFIEGQKPQGLYPLAYYPHNHQFMAFAATLAGKSALAIEAAKRTAATTPVGAAKQVPFLEPYLHYTYLTLVTFGRWDELLTMPLPPVDLAYSRGMAQYARGVALAAPLRGSPGGTRYAATNRRRWNASLRLGRVDDAEHQSPDRDACALGRDRGTAGRARGGHRAFPRGDEDRVRPAVYRAARLVLPDPPLAGRGAAPGRPPRGSGAPVSRGPQAVSGKRLVAVRTGTGAACAGEEQCSGGRGRPLFTRLGRGGRHTHGLPLLGQELRDFARRRLLTAAFLTHVADEIPERLRSFRCDRPSLPTAQGGARLEQPLGQDITAALAAAQRIEPTRRRVRQAIAPRIERGEMLLERREIPRGVARRDDQLLESARSISGSGDRVGAAQQVDQQSEGGARWQGRERAHGGALPVRRQRRAPGGRRVPHRRPAQGDGQRHEAHRDGGTRDQQDRRGSGEGGGGARRRDHAGEHHDRRRHG